MLVRIALHLDRDVSCKRRLSAAVQLAADHQAELIGIYTNGFSPHAYGDIGVPGESYSPAPARPSDEEAKVRKMFDDATASAGVTARWKAPDGEAAEVLALHARYCDLLVMSQPDTNRPGSQYLANLAESVMMAAGRPVLMIPYIGKIEHAGCRVLLCWDYRREAARAFTDAHPILQECRELVVLTIDAEPENLRASAIEPQDFGSYCRLRQYPLRREVAQVSQDVGIGNAILNAAADHGSDLIVMGAYGHSRLKERILGGASRTLLETMVVPVLFSH